MKAFNIKLWGPIYVGLFLVSMGLSWAFFSRGGADGIVIPQDQTQLEGIRSRLSDLPKTEACPINGGMFTTVERGIWESRRPLAVIIENHHDSRPPSGMSKSDVTYEFVAEGGVTRFLNIFYCGVASGDVQLAPIRSLRMHFLKMAAEYGDKPILVHIGGANNLCKDCPGGVKPAGTVAKEVMAVEEITKMGWRVAKGNDFDTTYDSGFPTFWRNYDRLDHEVATEHTMMSSTDKLYEQAEKRGFNAKDSEGTAWNENFVSWKFGDDKAVSSPDAKKISFEFWSNKPEYDVTWEYDQANNRYLRSNGGAPHTDLEFDNAQIDAKNVVVMFVKERGPVDRELHMYYEVYGTGDAIIFQNGTRIDGTWSKKSMLDRTKFMDEDGKEITFVRGRIFVEGLPIGNDVTVE